MEWLLRRRVWICRGLPALALAIGLLATEGCVSQITPPASPEDPVPIYVRWEARHKGLILPRQMGSWVEYGYGEFDWYALEKDRWYHVFDTVLWPTGGTLGRTEVTAQGREGLERFYRLSRLEPILVSRALAAALLARLDAEFAGSSEAPLHNSTYRMDFVPHEDGFWMFYNCNDAMADWLRALDCRVTHLPLRFGLDLERSAASGSP